ncbi:MAG: protein kinase domain-containing protein [Planctomycetales bacterium]
MPLALDQLVKRLEESVLLDGETLRAYLPPQRQVEGAEELLRLLVREKRLTRFQAEQVWQGKTKGLVLGNYVLLDKIGQGGMGAVYKAEHRRMRRIVALKLLPPAVSKDPAVVARFEREIRAAARLQHPNIVSASDADQANGVHFLVMEYVDGHDLSAVVKKQGPLTVEQGVDYVLQTARGLEFAHAAGVVHRDIKPGNLLLDRQGVVKILDMGLARLEDERSGGAQADLTSTGAVMGTVDYMAPEQALNTKSADARADIYSLGCTLHFLLTGQAPYSGDSLMARLLAHRDQPIPPLRAKRPEVSGGLDSVFQRMVAKSAAERFQTMTEVAAALESCLGTQVGSTAPQPAFDSHEETSLAGLFQEIEKSAGVRAPVVGRSAGLKRGWWIASGVVAGLLVVAAVVASLPRDNGSQPDKEVVKDGRPADKRSGKSDGAIARESGGSLSDGKQAADLEPQSGSTLPESERQRLLGEWLKRQGHVFRTASFSSDNLVTLPEPPWQVVNVELIRITDTGARELAELASKVDTVAEFYFKHTGNFTAAGLRELARIQSLQTLGGDFGQVQPTDFTTLAQLPLLSTLNVGNNPNLDDRFVFAATAIKSLNRLGINDCPITDAGVAHLKRLSELRDVYLNAPQLTDGVWEHLAQVPKLESLLVVATTRMRGTGMSQLEAVPLTKLILGSMPLSDESMAEVARIKSLRTLRISHAPIGDAGLKHLEESQLTELHLQMTQVTEAGLRRLTKALPGCRIDWEGGVIEPRS